MMFKIIFFLITIFTIWLVGFFWTPSIGRFIFWGLCGTYFLLIAPFVYLWWIIPNIEKRYGRKLIFISMCYRYDGIIHTYHYEISHYIVSAFLGHVSKNHYKALYNINYNVKTAPKSEIIVSFITVISEVFAILIPLIDYFRYA